METVINAVGLCKENILFGVDFSMEKGEIVAIMGPSGSGKSTLLYQLSGMDVSDGGQVHFLKKDLSKLSEDERAKERLHHMGFVFQQMNMLPNLNLIDNIVFPALHSQKTKEKDKKTEAELVKEAACICRAIMNQPAVLFADEPTGALNKSASEEIMNEFVRLNREGMSILIVTHDSKVASRCDRVAYMEDGQISGDYRLGKYHEEEKPEREREIAEWLEKNNW